MSKVEKIWEKLMSGKQDGNIAFSDLCYLLVKMGYSMRQKGSHHSFTKAGTTNFINIQPRGNKAKDYQVKQVRLTFQRL